MIDNLKNLKGQLIKTNNHHQTMQRLDHDYLRNLLGCKEFTTKY